MIRVGLLAALLLGALGLPALAQDCDPMAVSIASEPDPSQSPNQMRRGLDRVRDMPASADIVLLGDSLMEGWDKDASSDFGGRTVWNFAIGGDRTQQVLWRMGKADLARLKPSSVLLIAGTNNLSDTGMTGCAVAAGIRAIVAKAKAAWPDSNVFVFTVPPRGEDFHRYDEERKVLNEAIRAMADTDARIFPVAIDDNAITCGLYGDPALLPSEEKRCLAPDVPLCANYQTDNIHFQRKGYVSLLGTLNAVSAKTLGESFSSPVSKPK